MAGTIKRFEGPTNPTVLGPKPYKLLMRDDVTRDEQYIMISLTDADLTDYTKVCGAITDINPALTPADCPP